MEEMKVINIINVIAIILIPIVAVIIGQKLQDRNEKRKDKMNVFTHLMSYRMFGYTSQYSVNIFNSVPIVFYDDTNVIEKYNIYLKLNLQSFLHFYTSFYCKLRIKFQTARLIFSCKLHVN